MAENDYDIGRCDDCGSEDGVRRRVVRRDAIFECVVYLCADCRRLLRAAS